MIYNCKGIYHYFNEHFQFVKYSGKHIVYTINRQKDIECTFKDGLLDGELIKYYSDTGKIWAKFYFIRGLQYGMQYRYHPNGKIYTEEEYSFGIRHGYCKMFTEYGDCIETKLYQFGICYP